MARLKHAEIPVERVHTVVVTLPDHFGGSAQLRGPPGRRLDLRNVHLVHR